MSPYKGKYFTVKITVDGIQYWVRGKTKLEARKKAEAKRAELEAGRQIINGNMTVSEWAKIWLDTYKKKTVNKSYYRDITGQVKNRILPYIGKKRVRNVRPAELQKILNEMSDDFSASYIRSVRDLLKGMFREAYRNSMTLKDPAEGITLPKAKEKKKRRSITARERELTLQVAETNRGGLFVLIMLYAGLRPGEVAALQWTDIDMEGHIINVTKALKSDGVIGPPKTDAGKRKVPIPEPLYNRLSIETHKPFDYVCRNSIGKPLNRNGIRRLWEGFARDLNIAAGCKVFRNQVQPPYFVNDLTLYCYRHTYCTDLQAAGVPINVARELMGHKNISVTAQIYTHQSEEAFDDAAAKIEAFHNGKVAPKVAKNAAPVEITGL